MPGRRSLVQQEFARQVGALPDGATSTTSMAMLSRRKPWMKRSGFGSPSCSRCRPAPAAWPSRSARSPARDATRQILAEHPVVGPEIVSPLRDAVRFVDGDQRRLALRQHLRKAAHPQALRRDEQELQLAVQIIDASLARDAARSRPEWMRSTAKPSSFSLADLVLHQRDQRADHQRRAAPRDSRQLVAQRLARTRSASPAARPCRRWPPGKPPPDSAGTTAKPKPRCSRAPRSVSPASRSAALRASASRGLLAADSDSACRAACCCPTFPTTSRT